MHGCDHRLQELREQLLFELKTRSTVADKLKQHAASPTAGEEDMHKMYEARKFRDGIAKSIEILDSLT